MAAAAISPMPTPGAPPQPPLDYWQQARLKALVQAKATYKGFFRLRAQEFIRGKGTLAVVTDEVCMGCTHCFDNCAFEAIDMQERKFTLPEYSYTSRKAVIIEENCVGCEKCAIVCPVDAITMVTAEGFLVKEGRVTAIPGAQVPEVTPFFAPPKPGKPRPPEEARPFEKKEEAPKPATPPRPTLPVATVTPPRPAQPAATRSPSLATPPSPPAVRPPQPPAPTPPPAPSASPPEQPRPPERKKPPEEEAK